jgi:hypothetical protein
MNSQSNFFERQFERFGSVVEQVDQEDEDNNSDKLSPTSPKVMINT